MWELDHKESWALKNWCFLTVVLEKTLESPLDCKEIQPVHPKGNQSWIFIWRTDAEAEMPILWPLDAKNWLFGKDPDAGKDWRQVKKGATEDEMVGWHHWLNGHEFKQALGDVKGQGSLACCNPWGLKGSDTTEQLNNNNNYKATVVKTIWYWHKKQTHRSTEQNWRSPNKCIHIWTTIYDKGPKSIQWRKDSLFNKWCWENWTTTCKRTKLDHYVTQYTKINSKLIEDLNIRPKP